MSSENIKVEKASRETPLWITVTIMAISIVFGVSLLFKKDILNWLFPPSLPGQLIAPGVLPERGE